PLPPSARWPARAARLVRRSMPAGKEPPAPSSAGRQRWLNGTASPGGPDPVLEGQQIFPGETLLGGLAQEVGGMEGGESGHAHLSELKIFPLTAQTGDPRLGFEQGLGRDAA